MWWSLSIEPDYIPENQRPECGCRHCVTQGFEDRGPDCIWYRREDGQ
jgi:hypothetical protein